MLPFFSSEKTTVPVVVVSVFWDWDWDPRRVTQRVGTYLQQGQSTTGEIVAVL